MLAETKKRKRYLVTVHIQSDDRLEKLVVIAESPKAMQNIVNKLFRQPVGETEIVSFVESELL